MVLVCLALKAFSSERVDSSELYAIDTCCVKTRGELVLLIETSGIVPKVDMFWSRPLGPPQFVTVLLQVFPNPGEPRPILLYTPDVQEYIWYLVFKGQSW